MEEIAGYPEWFNKYIEGMTPQNAALLWDKYQTFMYLSESAAFVSDLMKGETTDRKPSNPKDRAATYRLDISLFPQTAIIGGALAMTEGDCKYGGYNYRRDGVCVSTYIAALDRHKFKFYNGQWADTKTMIAHLDSMIACCAILRDGFAMGNIVDDRPPSIDVDKMLKEAEEIVKHLNTLFPNGPGRVTQLGMEEKNVAS